MKTIRITSDRGLALPQGLEAAYEGNATVVVSGMPMEIVREDILDGATRIATAAMECLGLPLLSEEEMPTEDDKQRLLDVFNDWFFEDRPKSERDTFDTYNTAAIRGTGPLTWDWDIYRPSKWLLCRCLSAWVLCPENMVGIPCAEATIRKTKRKCPKLHLPAMGTSQTYAATGMLDDAACWIRYAKSLPDTELQMLLSSAVDDPRFAMQQLCKARGILYDIR